MLVLRSASCRPRWLASLAPVRASHSADGSIKSNQVFKQLGLYSLKKKIEDVVSHADMIAPTALEMEEARRIKKEEVLRKQSLWDDLAKSDECFTSLADSVRLVNDLKDLRYKAEEAKLIMELAEMDAISHELFEQAYVASLEVDRFIERYEVSKLLTDPYDKEGACLIIKAGPGHMAEVWAEKLLKMYTSWAEKHGCTTKIIERYHSKGSTTEIAVVEFESEYMYGYLSGERGVHQKICSSLDGSAVPTICSAIVDVIPIFLGGSINMPIDDKDLEISYLSSEKQYAHDNRTNPAVSIHHIPSGTSVQSSGERSPFANTTKALNRLKAKLLVVEAAGNEMGRETRRYIFHPHKMVEDVATGIQLADLNSVLNGDIEPLIRAHVSQRQGREIVGSDAL
ncbi:peptide chain release factor PrfB3, chloroplastic [Curcuma longa]|uniref:peptide chain release factor PrfB3, chloroplastic n=1 Tax=Curcuma longa TaxID=136217 RepID=UPI003D9DF313